MAEDTTTYPNLGFNPVPGVPDDVEALSGKISTAVNSLTEANGLIGRLKNAGDSIWQGDAGDAFRSHLDSTLVTDMSHAQTSLEKAVSVLGGWKPARIPANNQTQHMLDRAEDLGGVVETGGVSFLQGPGGDASP